MASKAVRGWRAAVSVALAMGMFVGPAQADLVYYVRWNGGSDSNDGETFGNAWRTIAKANSTLPSPNTANGDVYVHVEQNSPSTYDAFPVPVSAPADGKRFYFLAAEAGVPTTIDPSRTRLKGNGSQYFTTPYTTIRGFTVAGLLQFHDLADHSVFEDGIVEGKFNLYGCDYSRVSRTQILGNSVEIGNAYGPTISDSVIACTMPNLGKTGPTYLIKFGTTSGNGRVDSLQFEANSIDGLFKNQIGYSDMKARWMYKTKNSRFVDNRFDLQNDFVLNNSEIEICFLLRDSSNFNVFTRDTMIVTGPGIGDMYLSSSGSGCATCTPKGNTWDACFYAAEQGEVRFQDDMRQCTIKNSIFVFGGPALNVSADKIGPNSIDHNTFASNNWYTNAQNESFGGPVVDLGQAPYFTDSTRFTNNLLYSFRGPTMNPAFNSIDPDNLVCGLLVQTRATTADRTFDNLLKSNWNQYAIWPMRASSGDRTNGWNDPATNYACGGSSEGSSRFDYQSNGPCSWRWHFPATAEGRMRGDSLSIFASPQFDNWGPDSGFTLIPEERRFNPVPAYQTLNPGCLKDSSGSYIGALPCSEAATCKVTPLNLSFSGLDVGGGSDTLYFNLCSPGGSCTYYWGDDSDELVTPAGGGGISVSPGACFTTTPVIYTPLRRGPRTALIRVTANGESTPEFIITVHMD